MAFTAKQIDALKPKAARYEIYSDGEQGFGVRVSPSGAKTWITRYKHRQSGKLVKLTIGLYKNKPADDPVITLAERTAAPPGLQAIC